MKTKYTKGDWFIKNSDTNLYSVIYSKNGKRIAEVKSFGNSKIFNDPLVSERIANSKLMVSAPVLLDVLNEMLIYCRCNSTTQLDPIIRKAEEAIKKAIN